MHRLELKRTRLKRRVARVRNDIKARNPRPRLVLNRTNKYLWVQIIDSAGSATICAASTREKDFSGSKKNKDAAKKLGELIATRAQEKGIKQVVLDRRGRLYHGRIAAFADAAREKGLEF